MDILSSVPGRIRCRDSFFSSDNAAEHAEKAFESVQGILSMRVNRKASCIIIKYEVNLCSPAEISETLFSLCAETESAGGEKFDLNRFSKKAAIASFGISLASLAFKSRKIHAISGVMFTGFLAMHLFTHRKRLFR